MISAAEVKKLRDKTGAGMMDCKKALQEAGGDMEKAIRVLREKGLAKAAKRAGKAATDGVVDAYIHLGGKIGVLVEVNSETDFVARNEEFRSFVRDVAMQIAAANPAYLAREDVPKEALAEEREVLVAQAKQEGKPDHIVEKIVEGRLNKYYEEVCLLEQPFIKDQDVKVKELLNRLIAKMGENIQIRRFARFEVGEELGE